MNEIYYLYSPPPVPPFKGLHQGNKSQSMEMPRKPPAFTTPTGSFNSGLPPPVPQWDGDEDEDDVVEEVNTKISRPGDYNEIQYKAADPIAMRRKKKGGRSALARAQVTNNEPTSYKSAMVMNAPAGPPPVPTSAPRSTPKRMSAPSPFLQRKKSPKAAAPKKLSDIL